MPNNNQVASLDKDVEKHNNYIHSDKYLRNLQVINKKRKVMLCKNKACKHCIKGTCIFAKEVNKIELSIEAQLCQKIIDNSNEPIIWRSSFPGRSELFTDSHNFFEEIREVCYRFLEKNKIFFEDYSRSKPRPFQLPINSPVNFQLILDLWKEYSGKLKKIEQGKEEPPDGYNLLNLPVSILYPEEDENNIREIIVCLIANRTKLCDNQEECLYGRNCRKGCHLNNSNEDEINGLTVKYLNNEINSEQIKNIISSKIVQEDYYDFSYISGKITKTDIIEKTNEIDSKIRSDVDNLLDLTGKFCDLIKESRSNESRYISSQILDIKNKIKMVVKLLSNYWIPNYLTDSQVLVDNFDLNSETSSITNTCSEFGESKMEVYEKKMESRDTFTYNLNIVKQFSQNVKIVQVTDLPSHLFEELDVYKSISVSKIDGYIKRYLYIVDDTVVYMVPAPSKSEKISFEYVPLLLVAIKNNDEPEVRRIYDIVTQCYKTGSVLDLANKFFEYCNDCRNELNKISSECFVKNKNVRMILDQVLESNKIVIKFGPFDSLITAVDVKNNLSSKILERFIITVTDVLDSTRFPKGFYISFNYKHSEINGNILVEVKENLETSCSNIGINLDHLGVSDYINRQMRCNLIQ